MKAWWQQTAQRIDQLSQRERVFLFFSVLVIMVAIVDTLWLAPALDQQKKLSLKFRAQTAELDRLRIELQTVPPPVDANAAARRQIAEADTRLEAIDQAIAQALPAQDGGDLEKILVQFLRRQPGLTLVSTRTLDEATAPGAAGPGHAGAPAPAAVATAAPAAPPLPAGLQKRGLELRVAGSYAELVRYVKALEAALPSLRWGPMHLTSQSVAGPGNELALQVYVMGAQAR